MTARPLPLRCPCGRWGSFALVVTLRSGVEVERRACALPQCKDRAETERDLAALLRRTGGRGEVRPVDARCPHSTAPLRPPDIAAA